VNPPSRILPLRRRLIALTATGLFLMSAVDSAVGYENSGTQTVHVTIDGEVINPRISKYLFGINPFLYNTALERDDVFDRLKEAGVTVFAIPGGNPRGFYLWYVNSLRSGQLSEKRSTPHLVEQARRIGAEPIIGLNDRLGLLYDKSRHFKEWEAFFPAGPYKKVPDGVTSACDLLRYLNNRGFEDFNPYNPKHDDPCNVKWFELGSETFYWRVEGGYHGLLLYDKKTDSIRPKPTFYAFKFLRRHSHTDDTRDGSQLLKARSTSEYISVYPIRHHGNKLSVIVINKSDKTDAELSFSTEFRFADTIKLSVLSGPGEEVVSQIEAGSQRINHVAKAHSMSCLELTLRE